MNTNQQPETHSAICNPPSAIDLAAICRRHRLIPSPGHQPTLQEIIHALEQKLHHHQTHRSQALSPYSADHFEWQQIHDALTTQLRELHNSQTSQPAHPANPAYSAHPAHPPHPPHSHDSQNSQNSHTSHSPTQSDTSNLKSQLPPAKPADTVANQQNKPAENPRKTCGEPAPNSEQPAENPRQTPTKPTENPRQTSDPKRWGEAPAEPSQSNSFAQSEKEPPSESSANTRPSNSNRHPRPPEAPKRGPVGLLFQLPLETQQRILTLIHGWSISTACERLAKPAPDGFDIHVSEDTLSRFIRHHKLRREKDRHAQLTNAARKLLAASNPRNDNQLTAATLRLLKAQLLEFTASDAQSLSHLTGLHLILNRIRLTDLAERRVQLAEKRTLST